MAEAGAKARPLVHRQLFAITAQIRRDRLVQLEASPDVAQISTDAVVRSQAMNDTDASWAQLMKQRKAADEQLQMAVQAVNDHYLPKIEQLTTAARERRKATESQAQQRLEAAAATLATRLAAVQARADAAAVRRNERTAAANLRQAAAAQRRAERDAAANQRKLAADARRAALEAAANQRKAAATQKRQQIESAAAARKANAAKVRKDKVTAAEQRKLRATYLPYTLKRAEIAAADAEISAAYTAEKAEIAAADRDVSAAKTLESTELKAADRDISSARAEASAETAIATNELAAAKAEYETVARSVSTELGAAQTEYTTAMAPVVAEQTAAQAENTTEVQAATTQITQAAADFTADMLVVDGVEAERATLVKGLQREADKALVPLNTSLAANEQANVSEVIAKSGRIRDMAAKAPAALKKLLRATALAFEVDFAKTPRLRENDLIQSLGLERSILTGYDVGVAVIDSGVRNDGGELKVVHRYNFSAAPSELHDDFGHGTHVASLIGSNGKGSSGVGRGVAPGVRIVDLRVLDGQGAGYTSDVILAIDYAIANRDTIGIDVINL